MYIPSGTLASHQPQLRYSAGTASYFQDALGASQNARSGLRVGHVSNRGRSSVIDAASVAVACHAAVAVPGCGQWRGSGSVSATRGGAQKLMDKRRAGARAKLTTPNPSESLNARCRARGRFRSLRALARGRGRSPSKSRRSACHRGCARGGNPACSRGSARQLGPSQGARSAARSTDGCPHRPVANFDLHCEATGMKILFSFFKREGLECLAKTRSSVRKKRRDLASRGTRIAECRMQRRAAD
jgi:hypothetical protein